MVSSTEGNYNHAFSTFGQSTADLMVRKHSSNSDYNKLQAVSGKTSPFNSNRGTGLFGSTRQFNIEEEKEGEDESRDSEQRVNVVANIS